MTFTQEKIHKTVSQIKAKNGMTVNELVRYLNKLPGGSKLLFIPVSGMYRDYDALIQTEEDHNARV